MLIWNETIGKTESIQLTKGFVKQENDTKNSDTGTSSIAIAKDWVVTISPFHGDCVQIFDLSLDFMCGVSLGDEFKVNAISLDHMFEGTACQGAELGGHDIQVADFDDNGIMDFAAGFRGPDYAGIYVGHCHNTSCSDVKIEQATTSGASALAIGDFEHRGKQSIVYIGWGNLGDYYIRMVTVSKDSNKSQTNTLIIITCSIAVLGICLVFVTLIHILTKSNGRDDNRLEEYKKFNNGNVQNSTVLSASGIQ